MNELKELRRNSFHSSKILKEKSKEFHEKRIFPKPKGLLYNSRVYSLGNLRVTGLVHFW